MNGNAYQEYLAAQHGTGIGNYATDAGTHATAESILNTYSAQGLAVPDDVSSALQELNVMAANEGRLSGSTPGERRMLMSTGQYDPTTISARHQELLGFVSERTRDVANAGERIDFQRAQLALESDQLTVTEQRADADLNRILRPMTLEGAQLDLARTRLATEVAGVEAGNVRHSQQQFERSEQILAGIQGVSTQDMASAVRSRNPQTIAAVFGEGVGIDEAQRAFALRAQNEGTTQGHVFDESRAAAEVQQRELLIQEHGVEGLERMLAGDLPSTVPADVVHQALLTAQERDLAASGLATMLQDAQVVSTLASDEAARSDLLQTQMRAMSLTEMQELAATASQDPEGSFNIGGGPVEFSSQEILSVAQSVSADIEQREREVQANQVSTTAIDQLGASAEALVDNVQNLLGFVPSEVNNAVTLGAAQVRAMIARGDFAGALDAAGELSAAIEDGLLRSGMDEEQVASIMTNRISSEASYTSSVVDFLTSPTASSRMSQFSTLIADQLQSIMGDELTPENRARLATSLGQIDSIDDLDTALDEVGLTSAEFASTIENTYVLLATQQAAGILGEPGFLDDLGPDADPNLGQDVSAMLLEGLETAQTEGRPLSISDIMDATHTLSREHGLGTQLYDKMQEAFSRVDLSGAFVAPGGSSMQEAALVNLYAQGFGSSTGAGLGSIPISDSGSTMDFMLGRMLEGQLIARHNVPAGQTVAGERQTDFLLGQLMFGDTSVNQLMRDATADPRSVRTVHPQLAQEVARIVAQHQLMSSSETLTWREAFSFRRPGTDQYGPTVAEVREQLQATGFLEVE